MRGTRGSSAAPATPIDLDDLQLVNHARGALDHRAVARGRDDPDAEVIKTLLALTHGPSRRDEPYHIVAEIQDPQNLEAARLVGGDEAVLDRQARDVARLIVQTSRQSGAAVVYTELLDFDGDEIYFRADASARGQDLRRGAARLRGLRRHRPARRRRRRASSTRRRTPSDAPATQVDRRRRGRLASCDVAPAAVGAVDESRDRLDRPTSRRAPKRSLILGWNERAPPVIARARRVRRRRARRVTVVADVPVPRGALTRAAARTSSVDVRARRHDRPRALDALDVAQLRPA